MSIHYSKRLVVHAPYRHWSLHYQAEHVSYLWYNQLKT